MTTMDDINVMTLPSRSSSMLDLSTRYQRPDEYKNYLTANAKAASMSYRLDAARRLTERGATLVATPSQALTMALDALRLVQGDNPAQDAVVGAPGAASVTMLRNALALVKDRVQASKPGSRAERIESDLKGLESAVTHMTDQLQFADFNEFRGSALGQKSFDLAVTPERITEYEHWLNVAQGYLATALPESLEQAQATLKERMNFMLGKIAPDDASAPFNLRERYADIVTMQARGIVEELHLRLNATN
jgi:hypothetical protein